MTTRPDELLPTAGDIMKKLALAEAEEAAKQARALAEAEAEKQALLDHFKKPSGISDEEGIRRAVKIIERAVQQRLDRGAGLPFSKQAVHGLRACHQPAGVGLGDHADRLSQGDPSTVGEVLS